MEHEEILKQCGLGRLQFHSEGVLRAASGDRVEEQEREKGGQGVREAEKGRQVPGSRGHYPNSGHIGEARDCLESGKRGRRKGIWNRSSLQVRTTKQQMLC